MDGVALASRAAGAASTGFEGLTYVFQHGTADFGGDIPYSDDLTFDGVICEGRAPAIFASVAGD